MCNLRDQEQNRPPSAEQREAGWAQLTVGCVLVKNQEFTFLSTCPYGRANAHTHTHFEIRIASQVEWKQRYFWVSLIAQLVKNLPAVRETLVQFLGREDPPEKA